MSAFHQPPFCFLEKKNRNLEFFFLKKRKISYWPVVPLLCAIEYKFIIIDRPFSPGLFLHFGGRQRLLVVGARGRKLVIWSPRNFHWKKKKKKKKKRRLAYISIYKSLARGLFLWFRGGFHWRRGCNDMKGVGGGCRWWNRLMEHVTRFPPKIIIVESNWKCFSTSFLLIYGEEYWSVSKLLFLLTAASSKYSTPESGTTTTLDENLINSKTLYLIFNN